MMADFNIEKYRDPDECRASWNLRRRFLLENHDKFPENRLVCLAQCFVNVELYGNRYPNGVMIELNELSKGMPEIIEERKERAKSKHKTMSFVKASSSTGAAETSETKMSVVSPPLSSVEGRMSFVKSSTDYHSTDTNYSKYQDLNMTARMPSANKRAHFGLDESASSAKKSMKADFSEIAGVEKLFWSSLVDEGNMGNSVSKKKSKKKKKSSEVITENVQDSDQTFATLRHNLRRLGDTSQESPVSVLHMALQKAKMSPSCDFKDLSTNTKGMFQFQCTVSIDGIFIAAHISSNKKSAKKLAFEKALETILKSYHKITTDDDGEKELIASDQPFGQGQGQGQGKPFYQGQGQVDEEEEEGDYGMFDNGEFKVESNANQLGIHGVNRNKDLSDLIFLEHVGHVAGTSNAGCLLRQSADFSKMLLEFAYRKCSEGVMCRISLEGQPLVECSAEIKPQAKADASENAVDLLKKMCWTIKIKQAHDSDSTSFSKDDIIGDVEQSMCVIPDSNVGNKLLRKMGWVGGGVGKDGTGIAEPVTATQVFNRAGLGLDNSKGVSGDFKRKIKQVVENYASSDNTDDLVFAADLLKEERAVIHQHGKRLGLKCRSHGKNEDRYLIVSRKRTPAQLFRHIMSKGGSTSKYELIPPTP